MIRNLARCPYCGGCEVALDDSPELVFSPGAGDTPCAHLAWVDGRYSQWERSAQGIDRVIGSTEFRWAPPGESPGDGEEGMVPYLNELLNGGPGWAFAPPGPFAPRPLNAEERATDGKGKSHLVWDVDGWAVLAQDPAGFWAQLPGCRERWLASLDVGES